MSTDSPPLKKRKIRQCTFRKEWRSQPEYESWLLPVDDDATAARCTICASTFTVKFDGVSAVKHHASTQKHKQKSLASKQSATVKKFFVPAISSAEDHVTAAELGTIFHGIKHNYSYLSMDCGSKLAPKVFSDSDIASRMRLGRTKMEHLVKDVLAPYAVDGAGITDALIDFCEQADETSGGICELLATSLEKANLGLEILPGGQVAKLEFLNVYDRALAYLEKWFDFENSPFKMLAELDLRKGAPTTLVVINAGNLFGSDFQEEGDELYSELCLLKDALPGLLKCDEKSSSMWLKFLKAVKCPLLQNLMEHVYSIPCSNAFVERVFSVMGNLWTDERNQLSVPMVKAELCVRYNLVYSCEEFVKMARENKKLIRAAKSNSKYIFKFRE
ncbi:hypothetical protein HPB52_024054 [Rhipicephalus sanguineus]|uniref:HAT C-terminal dimerisation domain-containing protein n=1 Tax=Rhipicephalus sanguineus TaxID=34632 RepID=A0A9D4Q973_RHISA|nr:hypothetical protein HPB52_024054 [Rhipicephalus sanguineus]